MTIKDLARRQLWRYGYRWSTRHPEHPRAQTFLTAWQHQRTVLTELHTHLGDDTACKEHDQ